MPKNAVRLKAFNFLGSFDPKIKTKLDNICRKTGQYSVPDELFQQRNNRKNRVLISWKAVKNNNLTIEQLKTFSGGVAVEFVNEDFFHPDNQNDPLFLILKNKLGSDDTVSSIITIRSEGSSSSKDQRKWFDKLISGTEVKYNEGIVTLTKDNYMKFVIKQTTSGGIGNDKWSGFLFISIKGGNRESIESHTGNQTIFNPACEFANESVCKDIDLVMSYFALLSVDTSNLSDEQKDEYHTLMDNIKYILEDTKYSSHSCSNNQLDYSGNLLDYCMNHPSAKMFPGKLYDPIQVEQIHILDFAIDNKNDLRNLDFTHNEAVLFEKYYWDKEKKCILSPARPTNVFWSKHLSNMMQQNFSLDGYFAHQEDIIKKRKSLLSK